MSTSPTPSPPPIASETRSGLVSRVQQAIAGLKHFVEGLAISAGVALRFNGPTGDAQLTYQDPYLTSSKVLKVTATSGGAGMVLPADAGLDFGTLRLKLYSATGVSTLGLPSGAAVEFATGKTLTWDVAAGVFKLSDSLTLPDTATLTFGTRVLRLYSSGGVPTLGLPDGSALELATGKTFSWDATGSVFKLSAGLALPDAATLAFGTRLLKLYDAAGVPTLGLPNGSALELYTGKTLSWDATSGSFKLSAGLVLPNSASVTFGTRALTLYDSSGTPTLGLPDGAAVELSPGKLFSWDAVNSRFKINAPLRFQPASGNIAATILVNTRFKFADIGTYNYIWSDGTDNVFIGDVNAGGRLWAYAVAANSEFVGPTLRASTTSGLTFSASGLNGSSSFGFRFKTNVDLTASGAKLLIIYSGASDTERFSIDGAGALKLVGTGTASAPAFQVTKDGKLMMQAGDSSGAPGDATLNTPMGKSVLPAGSTKLKITNSLINTTSTGVDAWIQQAAADATLQYFINRRVGAGFFEVEGNAPATSNVTVWWRIIN